jgi:hypothetical protein
VFFVGDILGRAGRAAAGWQSLQPTNDCFLYSSRDIIQHVWNNPETLISVLGSECCGHSEATVVTCQPLSDHVTTYRFLSSKQIREVCRCRKIHRDFKTKRPHSKPGTPHTAVTISQTGFKPTRLIFWKKQHSVVILWYVTHSIQIHETLIWNPI